MTNRKKIKVRADLKEILDDIDNEPNPISEYLMSSIGTASILRKSESKEPTTRVYRINEDKYDNLSADKKVERLEKIMSSMGVCKLCGKMYKHDIETPYASCGCGTSEWYEYTPYMKLQSMIFMAIEAPLPPLPMNATPASNSMPLFFSRAQMEGIRVETRNLIIKELKRYK